MSWIDGWPVIGQVGADGIGSMVWSGRKPAERTPTLMPATSDDFDGRVLSSQWEWNYQPRTDKWSLSERPGWLRLRAFPPLHPGDLLKAICVGQVVSSRIFALSKAKTSLNNASSQN